jgi:hypothetical protein
LLVVTEALQHQTPLLELPCITLVAVVVDVVTVLVLRALEEEHRHPLKKVALVMAQITTLLAGREPQTQVVEVEVVEGLLVAKTQEATAALESSSSKCQATLLQPSQAVLRNPPAPLETLRFTP